MDIDVEMGEVIRDYLSNIFAASSSVHTNRTIVSPRVVSSE